MTHLQYDFTFARWDAILLAAVPALLNICIFAYIRLRIPDYKITRVFSMFLLALVCWQLSDALVRMSGNIDTARLWNSVLSAGALFTTSLGVHFALLFCGKKKLAESFSVLLLLYLPPFILLIFSLLHRKSFPYMESDFWGWVYKLKSTSLWALQGYLLSMQASIMLYLLLRRAFTLAPGSPVRKQALIIAVGFAIPAILGIATEVILPELEDGYSIPLTTTFLTCFSVATVIAMTRYRLFIVTESLKIPTILGALTDILVVISPDRTIRFMNKQGAHALGINPAHTAGMKLEALFANKEQGVESFMNKLVHPVLNGEKVTNYSTELIAHNRRITVLISPTSFKTSVHEAQLLLLIQDISEQVQTERQLAERESELREKSAELKTFFYRATHDLKGPSASIIGLVRLAKKEKNIDPQALQYISKIEDSAVRLESILLDFIRVIHIQERQLMVACVNFPQLVDEIIRPMQYDSTAATPNFRISILCRSDFFSDRGLVTSILYNLITNAVKYRKKGGADPYVSISVEGCEGGILARISDNGIGIPPEIRSDVFNIFFRGAESSKGTGLGLYIVKNAVTKLGGRIDLESEVGKGTTFTIFLPNLANEIRKTEAVSLSA